MECSRFVAHKSATFCYIHHFRIPEDIRSVMILHALDSGDKLLYELIRSHACIPVTPDGRKLSFVQDLINPTTQLAVLYSKGQHILHH